MSEDEKAAAMPQRKGERYVIIHESHTTTDADLARLTPLGANVTRRPMADEVDRLIGWLKHLEVYTQPPEFGQEDQFPPEMIRLGDEVNRLVRRALAGEPAPAWTQPPVPRDAPEEKGHCAGPSWASHEVTEVTAGEACPQCGTVMP